ISQRRYREIAAPGCRGTWLRTCRSSSRALCRAQGQQEAALMQTLRAWAIVVVFLTVTLIGIPYQSMALRFGWKRRKTFPHAYHRFMAKLFGVRIKTIGKPLTGEGVLIVANHTSWLDIIVFSAVGHVSFVAEVGVATL